jgi:hypothetical protein
MIQRECRQCYIFKVADPPPYSWYSFHLLALDPGTITVVHVKRFCGVSHSSIRHRFISDMDIACLGTSTPHHELQKKEQQCC